MKPPENRLLCCMVLLVTASHWVTSPLATAQPPSNVLLLVCDDLNCDIGCYGHPLVQTPNIDALAARGVRFERAYCQFPLCGPSRASFMTGLYPDQTLIRRNSIYIREHLPDVTTLPQLFRKQGYKATRIGKIYHYQVPRHIGTAGHDDPYSWNNTINPEGRDVHDEDQIFSLIPGSFGGVLSWLAAEGTDAEQTDGIAAAAASDALRGYARREQPFFLAIGLYRPHTPLVAPKRYFDKYPVEDIVVPTTPAGYLQSLPAPARHTLTRKKQNSNLPDKIARQAIQAYYASISFADAQIGKILATLEETGLDQNTIVVFTSDHGYHMGEHGHYQKTTLFENATRVPLIVAGPGVSPLDAPIAQPTEMVDIYPTVAELADLQPPKFLAGESLVPLLGGDSQPVRTSALSQYGTGYSIRTDRYRYTEWAEQGADGAELYDHRSDPAELINLAESPEYRSTCQELAERLRRRVAAARQPPVGLTQITIDVQRKVPH